MIKDDYVGHLVRVKENSVGCPTGVFRVAEVLRIMQYTTLKMTGLGYLVGPEFVEIDPKATIWDHIVAWWRGCSL
jgi:hypothetical protein